MKTLEFYFFSIHFPLKIPKQHSSCFERCWKLFAIRYFNTFQKSPTTQQKWVQTGIRIQYLPKKGKKCKAQTSWKAENRICGFFDYEILPLSMMFKYLFFRFHSQLNRLISSADIFSGRIFSSSISFWDSYLIPFAVLSGVCFCGPKLLAEFIYQTFNVVYGKYCIGKDVFSVVKDLNFRPKFEVKEICKIKYI